MLQPRAAATRGLQGGNRSVSANLISTRWPGKLLRTEADPDQGAESQPRCFSSSCVWAVDLLDPEGAELTLAGPVPANLSHGRP